MESAVYKRFTKGYAVEGDRVVWVCHSLETADRSLPTSTPVCALPETVRPRAQRTRCCPLCGRCGGLYYRLDAIILASGDEYHNPDDPNGAVSREARKHAGIEQ